jgi:predicted PurR-regulated permease PerM
VGSVRAEEERRTEVLTRDPQPVESRDEIWHSLTQVSTVGIFVLLMGACLYFSRPVLLPVLSALVIGMTLAPMVNRARQLGVPPGVTAVLVAVLLLAAAGLAATLLAAPISEWIGRAPEISASIKQKFYVFDRPLSALRELQEVLSPSSANTVAVERPQFSMVAPVVTFVTPAVSEAVVFLVTLIFFLAGQMEFRRYLASFFETRDAKLRFIRIANDIEHNLAVYVATVTVINVALGVVVTAGAWLFGLPTPLIIGILAMVLNYVPYIGPACMAVILLGIGLVSFPSLGYALLPPAAFIALTTVEGQFVTPTILGHNLTLSPLAIFLALAFWAWLWGPMGAFLAVPISIIGLVIIQHLFPADDLKLPE